MKNKKDMTLIIIAAIFFSATVIFTAILNRDEPRNVSLSIIEPSSTSAETTEEQTETETFPLWLDLNTASRDELKGLPEIGETLADRIIAYRTENKRFRNIEELMNVSGIGEKIFDSVKDFIYVTDPEYDEEKPSAETTTEPPTEPKAEQQESEAVPEDIIADEQPDEWAEPTELTIEDIAPIDLNTAEEWQLMLLPHVDEEAAHEIIELRESLGGFKNGYELAMTESLERWQISEILGYVVVNND